MARFHQGRFTPRHPEKYVGDANNIIYRSSWELSFLQWADSNPSIVQYASEELYIPYYFIGDRKWHRYYPDFIVQVQTKDQTRQTWMVEIKPYAQTQHPRSRAIKTPKRLIKETLEYAKNQAKWETAETFCREKGWRFMVLTERDIYPKSLKK